MSVKIYVSPKDATRVAKELLAATTAAGLDSSHVRLEKTHGLGFIVSDKLAENLDLTDKAGTKDADQAETESVSESEDERKPELGSDSVKPETTTTRTNKPKRGRPAGSKNRGASNG